MTRRRIVWRCGLVMAAAVLLGGCGELTAGGLGEVEVHVTADGPEDPGAAPSRARAPGGEATGVPLRALAADGLLAAELRAYVRSDATGEWIEITDGTRDLTLDLRGQTERRAGVRFLSEGSYSRFRLVFERVVATVTGGLVVDDIPILGEVAVELGPGGSLTVERDVTAEVLAGAGLDLLVDLNAGVWLPTLSLLTRTVAAEAFAGAVTVRVR